MHLKKHSDIDLGRINPVIFLRHAQSEGQLDASLYRTKGDANLDLTAEGRAQAEKIGKHLADAFHKAGWEAPMIISGESLRAQATANGVAKAFNDDGFMTDTRINKQSFGKFDGMLTSAEKLEKVPDLYKAYKEQEAQLGKLAVTPPEGESILDVIERVRSFLIDAAETKTPIIAVTHGLQMLCAEKITEDKSDEWLLNAQDSVKNVETLVFYPGN